MRGRIADWKDDRGFGFIEPECGGGKVFFHISAMARSGSRPSVGNLVSYKMTKSPDGKSRAVNVRLAGLAAVSSALLSRQVLLSLVALLVFPLLWWLARLGKLPVLLFWAFAAMSVVAFILYGLDKLAAIRAAQRTPEVLLQICALLGGWPGALLAQQVFRHKSSKRSFQIVFWLTVALNCGVLGLVGTQAGAALLVQLMQMVPHSYRRP